MATPKGIPNIERAIGRGFRRTGCSQAIQLAMITDPGKDPDDMLTVSLSMARMLMASQVNLLAGVANLEPSWRRAQVLRGGLDSFRQGSIPVGFGTNCNQPGYRPSCSEFQECYVADDPLPSGLRVLKACLQQAPPRSLTLLLISGLTDMAQLLEEYPELVLAKVAKVAIMGGVVGEHDQVKLDDEGFMVPDKAANNVFDMSAAEFVYWKLQEMRIPMIIVTRHAAAAAQVPKSAYEHMVDTGHPVAVHLKEFQSKLINHLWYRANLPAGHKDREGLPDDRDKAWFCKVFLGGKGTELSGTDDIWGLVTGFNFYDPLTLIASIPKLLTRFFEPEIVMVGGIAHYVIGVSAKKHNVKDIPGVVDFMVDGIVHAFAQSTDDVSAQVA